METVTNRYQLKEALGQGGMGAVFLATDRLSGQDVALKQVYIALEQLSWLSQSSVDQTIDELRFALTQEFQILAGLRHPNIISVLDYGFDAEQMPFYTMEYLPEAQTILEAAAEFDLAGKIDLVRQILQALTYLHRWDVLHRDLKPNNILYSNQRVRLVDFGLASYSEQNASSGGTLLYMAPEILVRQNRPYVKASDLYAVGVILYQMLAGEHPFDIKSNDFAKQVLNDPPDLSKLGVEEPLAAFVGRLLAKNPADRYESVELCLAAFHEALGQPAPPETSAIRESYLQAAAFVGRDSERSQLQDALTAAKNGTSSAWLIGGESGVGKSRLLNEVRTLALVAGFQVLRGQGTAGGSHTYKLWQDIIPSLALSTTLSDLEASVLNQITPSIQTLLGKDIPPPPELSGEAIQTRLVHILISLLQRLSQPTLILFEDLQWMHESLIPLQKLARDINQMTGLVVICTYRSDERPDLPNQLADMQAMTLSRLSEDEIVTLSQAMLGEHGTTPQIAALLTQETEGNTFFVVEVMRALAEEAGQLDKISQMTLPEGVLTNDMQHLLQRRIRRIPPEDQALLQVAAIAGRQLDLTLLKEFRQDQEIDIWLQHASDASVLMIIDGQWAFAHDKLREAVLLDISQIERRQGHQHVAEAIEAVYGDRQDMAPLLAEHWREAGNTSKEVSYAIIAHEHLHWSGAYNEAIQLLQYLLTNYSDTLADETKLQLFKFLGDSYRDSDQYSEAKSYFQAGVALAQRIGSQEGIVAHLNGLGWAAWRHLQFDRRYSDKPSWMEAESYLQEAFELAHQLEDKLGMAQSLYQQANIALHGFHDYDRFITLIEPARDLFQELGKTEWLIGVDADTASAFMSQNNAVSAKETTLQAISIAHQIGSRNIIPYLICTVLEIFVFEQDWEQFEQYLQELSSYAISRQNLFHYREYIALKYIYAFHSQDYALAETLSDPFLAETITSASDIWYLQALRGAAVLMQNDKATLRMCLTKTSVIKPSELIPLFRDYLWVLYAGITLLENRVELGAAWLGHYQAYAVEPNLTTYSRSFHTAELVERIRAKFQHHLSTPEAVAAAEKGATIDPEAVMARWPQTDITDEAGLEKALTVIASAATD